MGDVFFRNAYSCIPDFEKRFGCELCNLHLNSSPFGTVLYRIVEQDKNEFFQIGTSRQNCRHCLRRQHLQDLSSRICKRLDALHCFSAEHPKICLGECRQTELSVGTGESQEFFNHLCGVF